MSTVRKDAIPFETLLLEESRYPGFSLGDPSLDSFLGNAFRCYRVLRGSAKRSFFYPLLAGALHTSDTCCC